MALPAVHALSGCDSTSSFSGIGKKRWLKAAVSGQGAHDLLKDIARLGDDPSVINDDAFKACVSFVSHVYGGKSRTSLNDVRYELFSRKNLSSEKLPPTDAAFQKHMQRVNYQVYISTNATHQMLNVPPPTGRG